MSVKRISSSISGYVFHVVCAGRGGMSVSEPDDRSAARSFRFVTVPFTGSQITSDHSRVLPSAL
jgi:hypothetical protein